MSLRKPLRTFTRAVARVSRFLLVYLLCICMVLLPVPLARADFPDADGNFTLWLEAGRAAHTFEIWDPAASGGTYYSGMGSLVQPGGTRITGTMQTGTPSLLLRDVTSGEVAPLPSDANGMANLPRAAWTSESGNPVHTLHFLVDSARAWDSVVLSQPNGAYFVASPTGRWVEGSRAEFSSPYDPGLSYRVLDLSTGEQTEENASDTSLSAWSAINPQPPLASVTFAVDAIEEGHWFTIHAQYPGGPEMLQRVQAVRGYYFYATAAWWDQNATILTASVGLGMNITVERDADHFSVGGMQVGFEGGSYQSFPLYGSFPAVPDRGHPLVPQQISIVDELITGADASFTLWLADGYRTDFSLSNPGYNSVSQPRTWTTTPLRDGSGAVFALMDDFGNTTTHAVYQITLDVDPQQSWWLVNNTTGEQYPNGKTEILGAYENYHVNLPPADWSTLTLSLHSSQKDSELLVELMYPSGSVDGVLLPAVSSYDHYARFYDTNGNLSYYPLSPSWETLLLYNYDTYEPYELTGFTLTIPNPRPYEWPNSATISDQTRGLAQSFSPAAHNDLLDWQTPPTPTTFSISSSRWGHELVIRRADGREDYPIQAHSIEGDYSPGWANSYYYYTATGLTFTDPQWRVVDKTTGEQAGDYQTDLIDWVVVSPPTDLTLSLLLANTGAVELAWPLAPNSADGSFIVERSIGSPDRWHRHGTVLGTSVVNPPGTAFFTDALPFDNQHYYYRVRYVFGGRVSGPSNVVEWVGTSDNDGNGIKDEWEITNFGSIGGAVPGGDADGDGLTNVDEYWASTNPNETDTDGDGLSDSDDDTPINPAPTLGLYCWVWGGRVFDAYGLADLRSVQVAWHLDPGNGLTNLTLQRADGNSGVWYDLDASALTHISRDDNVEFSCLNYRYRLRGTLSSGKKRLSHEAVYVVPLLRALVVQRAYSVMEFPGFTEYTDATITPPINMPAQKYLKEVYTSADTSAGGSSDYTSTLSVALATSDTNLETIWDYSSSERTGHQDEVFRDRSPTPSNPLGIIYHHSAGGSTDYDDFMAVTGTETNSLTANITYVADSSIDNISKFMSFNGSYNHIELSLSPGYIETRADIYHADSQPDSSLFAGTATHRITDGGGTVETSLDWGFYAGRNFNSYEGVGGRYSVYHGLQHHRNHRRWRNRLESDVDSYYLRPKLFDSGAIITATNAEYDDNSGESNTRYTWTLSEPCTTEEFVSAAIGFLPPHPTGYSEKYLFDGDDHHSWGGLTDVGSGGNYVEASGYHISLNEAFVHVSRGQYRLLYYPIAQEPEYLGAVIAYERFTPDDNPATPNVNESEAPTETPRIFYAQYGETESPLQTVNLINPAQPTATEQGATTVAARPLPVEAVTINTFIPHDNVSDPLDKIPIPNPSVIGPLVWGGNFQMNASGQTIWNKEGSFKTQQRFVCVPFQSADADGLQNNAFTDPGAIQTHADGTRYKVEIQGPNNAKWQALGETREYDKGSSLDASEKLTAAAKADDTVHNGDKLVSRGFGNMSGMSITSRWISERKLEIRCIVSVSNPTAVTPPGFGIDYDFTLTLDHTDISNPKYSLAGKHDGFPAYEVYIGSHRIYEHDPVATNEGLMSLASPMEHNVPTSRLNQPIPQ